MFALRDELHESNVVTKTFIVDDVGPPSDDVDSLFNGGGEDEENGLMVPTRSLKRPYSANRKKVSTQNILCCIGKHLIHAKNNMKTTSKNCCPFIRYSL